MLPELRFRLAFPTTVPLYSSSAITSVAESPPPLLTLILLRKSEELLRSCRSLTDGLLAPPSTPSSEGSGVARGEEEEETFPGLRISFMNSSMSASSMSLPPPLRRLPFPRIAASLSSRDRELMLEDGRCRTTDSHTTPCLAGLRWFGGLYLSTFLHHGLPAWPKPDIGEEPTITERSLRAHQT